MPWLPFPVIDLLDKKIDRGSRIFEFGGGGSTAWFADRAGTVITVEHDLDWLQHLSGAESLDNVTLVHKSDERQFADYVGALDDFTSFDFDVIVVDGRERVRCFENAVTRVKPGGLLIFDDVERERYGAAFEMVDWKRHVYHAFSPGKRFLSHTAVFFAPMS